jgi:archaellum biogenesis ATPase FlaH
MSQLAIEKALLEENRLRCEPPLPESEVRQVAASVARYEPTAASGTKSPPGAPHGSIERLAKLVRFAEIQPKPLRWVWRDRIPAGKLSLIVGDPDKGKSLITLDMAARITTGRPFPDGAPSERGSVIILSAEDDSEDTIRPRLDAAGADVSRVHWLEAVRVVQRDGKQGERTFSLESDIEALADAVKQEPDVRLIVIDPISAYLGGADSHKNSEVRGLLAPLKEFTARTGVTVLGITHLRKSSGPAIHRSIDSIAFAAAARAVWGVAEDPEDPDKRIMLRVKGNLSHNPGGLAYRIEELPSGIPCIVWEPGAVNLQADDVLGGLESREDSSERHEAAQWLREFLADGPKPTREIEKQTKGSGLRWATVRRAKDSLGIRAEKSSFRGVWEWSLPEDAQPASSQGAQPQRAEVSAFGDTRINKGDGESQSSQDAHPAQVSNLGGKGSTFTFPSEPKPVADDEEVSL